MKALGHYLPGAVGAAAGVAVIAATHPEGWWWIFWGYCAIAAMLVVAWIVRGWRWPPPS